MSEGVQIAYIGGATSIVIALLTFLFSKLSSKISDIHVDINSRLSQLVIESKKASHAEGKAEGIVEERAKTEVTLKVSEPPLMKGPQ